MQEQTSDFVLQEGDKMMERKISFLLENKKVIRTVVYEKARELTEEELREADKALEKRVDWGTTTAIEPSELISLLKNRGGVTIDLSTGTTSYYNPLEIGFNPLEVGLEDDLDKRLDENTIPLINSAAQLYKGFNLSEPEIAKIKEIVIDGYKNQKDLNILQLRDELIKQNNTSLDLSRVIELLNHFL